MALFKICLSFLSIIIVGVFFIYRSILKRKGLRDYSINLYYKRLGVKCFNCPEVIVSEANRDYWDIIEKNSDNNFVECVSCHRNSRLNMLMNFTHFRSSFNKLVLSRVFEKWSLAAIFIPLICIIIALFVQNKSFSDFSSLFNSSTIITYWMIQIYRVYLCRE